MAAHRAPEECWSRTHFNCSTDHGFYGLECALSRDIGHSNRFESKRAAKRNSKKSSVNCAGACLELGIVVRAKIKYYTRAAFSGAFPSPELYSLFTVMVPGVCDANVSTRNLFGSHTLQD